MLDVFLVMGKEVALIAEQLQANYLTVHMPIADGAVVAFTWEDGAVWATGRGFDVELSALRPWRGRDLA